MIRLRARRAPRQGDWAFVLLEVLLATVIAGATLIAALTAFIRVMGAVRDKEVMFRATLIAESIMAEFEIEPPPNGLLVRDLGDDPRWGPEFASYTIHARVRSFEPRYREDRRNTLQDLEHIHEVELIVHHEYDRRRRRAWAPVRATTYLVEPTIFTDDALFRNQLF